MNELEPVVGNWYKNLADESDFQVVALDETAQTVEIQYSEGELEELDLDTWYELELELIAPPDDWSGPFDDLDRDDLGYDDGLGNPKEHDPLAGLE
jgi:hypothetical protein